MSAVSQLERAVAHAATIDGRLQLHVEPGLVRAVFEQRRNNWVWDRYGFHDPLWRNSVPMGGDRVRPVGGLGAFVEMACADLLAQVELMEAGQRRPDWPWRATLPELADPPRPALTAALNELRRWDSPMGVEIEQLPDGSAGVRANVLRGFLRTPIARATAGAGDPLMQQEAALTALAAELSGLDVE